MERRPKVVYVAGPYRADTQWGIGQNVQTARQAAFEIMRLSRGRIYVVCPHANTDGMGYGAESEQWFIDGGSECIRRSDGVYVLHGWQNSEGTRAEINAAHEAGVPVYFQDYTLPSRFVEILLNRVQRLNGKIALVDLD